VGGPFAITPHPIKNMGSHADLSRGSTDCDVKGGKFPGPSKEVQGELNRNRLMRKRISGSHSFVKTGMQAPSPGNNSEKLSTICKLGFSDRSRNLKFFRIGKDTG